MSNKKAYFSVDLELLSDIEKFVNIIKEEPDYSKEILTLLNLLDEYNIKATFFACYNYILKNKQIIEELLKRGHDLGLHYVNHKNEDINIDTFIKEVSSAKENIKAMFEVDVIGYRAPSFNLTNEQYQALKELGFKYDSSYFIYKKANYKSTFEVNDKLKEFPVWNSSSYPLAGGAYLRLLPGFLMKKKLKKHLKKNKCYNFYVHPYDFSTQKIYKKGTSLKLKLFFSKNTNNYLTRIKWLIEQLFKNDFIFKLYKEEIFI